MGDPDLVHYETDSDLDALHPLPEYRRLIADIATRMPCLSTYFPEMPAAIAKEGTVSVQKGTGADVLKDAPKFVEDDQQVMSVMAQGGAEGRAGLALAIWTKAEKSDVAASLNQMTAEAIERLKHGKVGYDQLAATSSARKWWDAFEKNNAQRPTLVLGCMQELANRNATIYDLYMAWVYSDCDSIQANLDYLDFRKSAFGSRKSSDAATAPVRGFEEMIAKGTARRDVAQFWREFQADYADQPIVIRHMLETLRSKGLGLRELYLVRIWRTRTTPTRWSTILTIWSLLDGSAPSPRMGWTRSPPISRRTATTWRSRSPTGSGPMPGGSPHKSAHC